MTTIITSTPDHRCTRRDQFYDRVFSEHTINRYREWLSKQPYDYLDQRCRNRVIGIAYRVDLWSLGSNCRLTGEFNELAVSSAGVIFASDTSLTGKLIWRRVNTAEWCDCALVVLVDMFVKRVY